MMLLTEQVYSPFSESCIDFLTKTLPLEVQWLSDGHLQVYEGLGFPITEQLSCTGSPSVTTLSWYDDSGWGLSACWLRKTYNMSHAQWKKNVQTWNHCQKSSGGKHLKTTLLTDCFYSVSVSDESFILKQKMKGKEGFKCDNDSFILHILHNSTYSIWSCSPKPPLEMYNSLAAPCFSQLPASFVYYSVQWRSCKLVGFSNFPPKIYQRYIKPTEWKRQFCNYYLRAHESNTFYMEKVLWFIANTKNVGVSSFK